MNLTSIIRINDLREVISNLEYLIQGSKDQSVTDEYNVQLATSKERLLALMIEVPVPHQRLN
jgi:hypothetical protein